MFIGLCKTGCFYPKASAVRQGGEKRLAHITALHAAAAAGKLLKSCAVSGYLAILVSFFFVFVRT